MEINGAYFSVYYIKSFTAVILTILTKISYTGARTCDLYKYRGFNRATGILRKSPFQLVKERVSLFDIQCKIAYVGSNHYQVVIHVLFQDAIHERFWKSRYFISGVNFCIKFKKELDGGSYKIAHKSKYSFVRIVIKRHRHIGQNP